LPVGANRPDTTGDPLMARRNFFRSLFAPAARPKPIRRNRLSLEQLEARTVPTVFTVLDSFSGAILSTAGGLESPGLFCNSVTTTKTGTDVTLRTGTDPNSAESPTPNQLADSRSATITRVTGTGTNTTDVFNGLLEFSQATASGANLDLNYTGLS